LGTLLYLAYLAAHVVMIAWGLALVRRHGPAPGLVALVVVSVALVYDTAVVSSGHLLGESNALRGLNWVRFLVGDLCVPLLAVPPLEIGRWSGFDWARRIPAWWLAILLMVLGVVTEMINLQLYPDPRQGVLRYSAVHPGLPYAAVAVTILALAVGIQLWRRRDYPVLLATSAITFVVSALPITRFGVAPQSGAEVVFMIGLYVAYGWLPARRAAPARGSGRGAAGLDT